MNELLSKTKEMCRLFALKPQRSKGQNFLISEDVYNTIITASKLNRTDSVLEVGPGLGFLTAKLAPLVQKVVAVELDDKLANILQTAVDSQGVDNIKIINEDILRLDPRALFAGGYKIVANLPYNITSIFLRKFLSTDHRPEIMILMLQKEVAERITASAGSMSLLAISVQYYAQAKIIKVVKSDNFWPQPQVDSAIIEIKITTRINSPEEDKLFFRLVRIAFSAKRKMLKNNLVAGLKIEVAEIENILLKIELQPQVRAEALKMADWYKLFAKLREFMV